MDNKAGDLSPEALRKNVETEPKAAAPMGAKMEPAPAPGLRQPTSADILVESQREMAQLAVDIVRAEMELQIKRDRFRLLVGMQQGVDVGSDLAAKQITAKLQAEAGAKKDE